MIRLAGFKWSNYCVPLQVHPATSTLSLPCLLVPAADSQSRQDAAIRLLEPFTPKNLRHVLPIHKDIRHGAAIHIGSTGDDAHGNLKGQPLCFSMPHGLLQRVVRWLLRHG